MKDDKREKERGKTEGEQGRVEVAWGQQVRMAARPPPHPPRPDSCAQHPAWVPLCIRTLLGALQGRWGLQAGRALRGRVPQLRGGLTCGRERAGLAGRPSDRDSTLGVCFFRRGMRGGDHPLLPHLVPALYTHGGRTDGKASENTAGPTELVGRLDALLEASTSTCSPDPQHGLSGRGHIHPIWR